MQTPFVFGQFAFVWHTILKHEQSCLALACCLFTFMFRSRFMHALLMRNASFLHARSLSLCRLSLCLLYIALVSFWQLWFQFTHSNRSPKRLRMYMEKGRPKLLILSCLCLCLYRSGWCILYILLLLQLRAGWLCACVERNDCFALMRSRTTIDR